MACLQQSFKININSLSSHRQAQSALTFVRRRMILQVMTGRESGCAALELALERPFTAVDTKVLLQVTPRRELLAALDAAEHLTVVKAQVRFQAVKGVVAFTTH